MNRRRLPGTPEPDRFFDGAEGNQIAADEWGVSNEQPVYLLHGGGQTRHAWKGTGEELANRGYHTIALDARGHGDSDWLASQAYDHQSMIQDLQHIVDHAKGPKPVFVGASMGGMISLGAIGGGMIDAAALVLVDIAPTIEVDGAERIRDFMRQGMDGFDSLDAVADAISNYQPQRNRPRKLDGLAKNVRQGDDGRYYWHWDPAYISGKTNVNSHQERLQECARNLTIPTLLVRGGMSDVVSEAGAEEFLSLCPHAEYANVTDAAHMVAGDRNDIFTTAVVEFLDRVVPQPKDID